MDKRVYKLTSPIGVCVVGRGGGALLYPPNCDQEWVKERGFDGSKAITTSPVIKIRIETENSVYEYVKE